MINVTDGTCQSQPKISEVTSKSCQLHTNVNVGLSSLESSRKRAGCVSLVGEDMVHRIGSARTQQGGPAAPQEEVD